MVGGTAVCSEIGPLVLGDAGFFSTVRKMRIEVGYPPYKMPEKTWPICVQELSWPRLWENVHIWLNEVPVCIRGDEHEGKDSYIMLRSSAYQFGNPVILHEPGYTSCCTKQYRTQKGAKTLLSPYSIKQVGGEVVPGGRDYDPDHTHIKSHEKTVESSGQALYEPKSSSTNFNLPGSSIKSPLDIADSSLIRVAPQAAKISIVNLGVEEAENTKLLSSEDLLSKGDPLLPDVFSQVAETSSGNAGVEGEYREPTVDENKIVGQNTIADAHIEPHSSTNGILDTDMIEIGLYTAGRRAKRQRLD